MSGNLAYTNKPWLDRYDPEVTKTVSFENVCLHEYLDRSAKEFPNNNALNFLGYRLNYSHLLDTVDRMATCLTDFGIKKGDRVAIHLPNTIPCVVAYYAALKIGAVVVMNNPTYSPKELEHQYTNSDAKVLFTLDLAANMNIDLRPKTRIKQIIYTSLGDYLPLPEGQSSAPAANAVEIKSAPNMYRWKDLVAKYQPTPPRVKLTFDDVAQLQYTGGTTGVSKGVVLTHGNLSKQVQQMSAWFPEFYRNRGKEKLLGALPFYHVFGLSASMNYAIYLAGEIILVPRPHPDALIEAFRKFRPTHAAMVPTMFIGILNHPRIDEIDISSVKGCFCGSAPLPVEVIKAWEAKTTSVICEGFGMTESSPITHINPFLGTRKPGSIGLPLPNTECRIVDIEGRGEDVPVGKSGELIIRGPQVMREYWNMPQETAQTLKDGWLHSGDVATMDDEGYFYIVDRLKDMVISGGFNVYPREIDEVLYSNPKIEEACAIGISHKTRGESIKAFVVLKKGQTATSDEIIEYCKGRLATYKLPVVIEFRDQLPKSTVGKVLRKELRAEELKRNQDTSK
ncbi:MAG: long-chain fatty acid--CoA ligase [Deltaproteobacteria bacterium]|nr:long-chain fatty acid--CoA ligase [Deltaproteobacteria bacterium]